MPLNEKGLQGDGEALVLPIDEFIVEDRSAFIITRKYVYILYSKRIVEWITGTALAETTFVRVIVRLRLHLTPIILNYLTKLVLSSKKVIRLNTPID